MLIIKKAKIFQVRIPFSVQVTHNLAKRQESHGFLLELTDKDGLRGYGEGTPRSYVTGEAFEETKKVLNQIAGELVGYQAENEGIFLHFLEQLKEDDRLASYPSALCCLELALLDLYCKRISIPIWKLVVDKPATDTISYSSILPLLSSMQRKSILRLTKQFQIRQIKTKATSIGDTLKVVTEIQNTLGADADIRIDANGAFSAEQAIGLAREIEAAGLSISSLEQPVPKEDLEGMKEVEKATGLPTIADESFCSKDDLQRIIAKRSCKGLNVRLSKCGGLLNCKDMVECARNAGLFCQLGCHVGETSILYAAGRQLAAICGPFRYTEGCYSKFLLKEDIVLNPLEFGLEGKTTIPTDPGLGVKIKESALRRYCHPVAEIY